MRMPRLDFPGARHHVMNRGARREPIFLDDDDRRAMLDLLADLPERFGVRVHGYALMPNHYHLMLESVWGELPRAMRHVGGEFAQRLNRRYRWDGPVYKGRYRNRMVGTDAYWRHLLVYLHLNPHRAGLDDCESLLWTSHAAYTGDAERPPWLSTDALTTLFGRRGDYLGYHDRVRHGDAEKPADFDPKQLWAPATTGVVAVPNARDPLWSVSDALAAVCKVTGLALEQVLTSKVGRGGNPANWLAAWWLSRGCGIPHGRIGAALGIPHVLVSQRDPTNHKLMAAGRCRSRGRGR